MSFGRPYYISRSYNEEKIRGYLYMFPSDFIRDRCLVYAEIDDVGSYIGRKYTTPSKRLFWKGPSSKAIIYKRPIKPFKHIMRKYPKQNFAGRYIYPLRGVNAK